MGIDNLFPFNTQLSVHRLIEYWQKQSNSDNKQWAAYARSVVKASNAVPELQGVIADGELFAGHSNVSRLLFSSIFPSATWNKDIKAVMSPFGSSMLYATPECSKLMEPILTQIVSSTPEQLHELSKKKISNAYLAVLKEIYKVDIEYEIGMTFPLLIPETGLIKYYYIALNLDFVDIECVGDAPPLSQSDIKELLNNLNDTALWMQKLPPAKFLFKGFTILNPIDITDSHTSSLLKQDLLKKDSLIDPVKFVAIQQKIRNLLGLPEMLVGIGAPSSNGDEILQFGPDDQQISNYIRSGMTEEEFKPMVCGMMSEKKPVIVEDVAIAELPGDVQTILMKNNIRNVAILPLELGVDDRALGLLQLGTPYPNKLNNLSIKKLVDLLPVIATAVKQSTEEVENEIQRVILNKFTALHKTVEWKFREVAKQYRNAKLKGLEQSIPAIVFEDVFPIYGISDIRNSSDTRKASIQQDMLAQLHAAAKVIDTIISFKPLPIYEESAFRVAKKIREMGKRMVAQDEGVIYDFFAREIEPMLKHVAESHPELHPVINTYFDMLDEKLGVLYDQRKSYEDSINVINSEIYSLLEREEESVQEMFPYFFENYKTDGVEYNIYIGQSLVNDRKFHPIYLQNLRLWQLMLMCKIARKSEEIKPKLSMPLDTAHLILVQSTPLSIRFRVDEKKFDVDGAYNVRYEIMKKRVDKALVKGKKERLTQPGKIAIVYSNPKDLKEYQKYLEFLVHKKSIKPEIELLDLEELQGVEGLKAIRVEVVSNGVETPDFSTKLLSEIESRAKVRG